MIALALLLAAQPQLRIVAEPPASAAAAEAGVSVFVLNEGTTPADAEPRAMEVVTADRATLRIEPVDAAPTRIAPGGFAKLRYRIVPVQQAATGAPVRPTPAGETQVATAQGSRAGLLDRFEAHEPIYGAFGTGSDGAKLQVSLAFRPFDGAGLLDDVRLAWTQTMFWAIDRSSGPFRSTNYSPEVYYQRRVTDRIVAGGGYAHDSNGRDAGSIDVNRLFAAVTYTLPVGDGWQVEATPRLWTYVGTGYRDLDRYWGNMSLGAAIGQVDGLRVAATLRNPTGQRRAGELYLSYPLARIGAGTGFYLFGQAFTGYGEAIDDYALRSSSARLGIAFTR
ncbi:phospholipase A [Sphingomonas sp. 2R-10]|uniref:phospholipase A n=1 Tax=Sphingomonas sp. 2R-10 TaxID=3045148 RepID=UPI000F7AFEBA|nr:phospholipase A [Sphingomonas sp. 2R-10]MDJ0275244.1 phospholipase A [Sphingomonas sp. 2R-10]